MLHERAPGLTEQVRSLDDLKGDALAVGDQRDANLLGFPQRFWVDLVTVEVFCINSTSCAAGVVSTSLHPSVEIWAM